VAKRDGRCDLKEEATQQEFVLEVAPTRSKSRRERALVLLELILLDGITTFPELVRAVTGERRGSSFVSFLVGEL
jgi:hypothetical protein